MKCWGGGGSGRLGDGVGLIRGDNGGEMGDNLPTVDLGTGKKAKQIFANVDHMCILDDDR